MIKKELFIPIIFISLSTAFLVISGMVFLSNGNSKKWVARKMKIGGLLLSLSFFSCGNSSYQSEQSLGCYMIIDTSEYEPLKFPEPPGYYKKIEIEIDSDKIIYGNISGRSEEDLSYALFANGELFVQKGDIITKRWAFDPEYEEFVIKVNQNIVSGKYQLKLYKCSFKEQDSNFIFYEHDLIIKKQ